MAAEPRPPGFGAMVLIVEDDPVVSELVAFHLKREGFRVRGAATQAEAWKQLAGTDLIVLDRMLPDGSGIDFLKRLRMQTKSERLPVLMLTARATEVDRVGGLDAGADDYLVKPFGTPELVARVRALLRRTESRRRLAVGSLEVDLDRGSVTCEGRSLELTRREFELVAFLAASPGRIFSRGELLDRVWGEDFLGTERTVDQHVAQVRAQLGADVIETIRGRGYRLVDPGRRN